MSSPLFDPIRNAWQKFDHGQQIALSILAPCSVIILILGAVSLHASVSMPFRAPRSVLTATDALLKEQRALNAKLDQAQSGKDTDGDGLNDLDETGTYRTSPYLTDTDSDGISDGDEVRAGTDPNCAPDRDCYGFAALSADAMLTNGEASSTEPVVASGTTLEKPLPPDQVSPAQIRAYLVRTGLAPAEQVDTLPDAAVIELYGRAYADLRAVEQVQAAPPAPPSTPPPASTSPSTSSTSL